MIEDLLDHLKDGASEQDVTVAGRYFHQLKGAAGSVGLMQLSAIGKRGEALCDEPAQAMTQPPLLRRLAEELNPDALGAAGQTFDNDMFSADQTTTTTDVSDVSDVFGVSVPETDPEGSAVAGSVFDQELSEGLASLQSWLDGGAAIEELRSICAILHRLKGSALIAGRPEVAATCSSIWQSSQDYLLPDASAGDTQQLLAATKPGHIQPVPQSISQACQAFIHEHQLAAKTEKAETGNRKRR